PGRPRHQRIGRPVLRAAARRHARLRDALVDELQREVEPGDAAPVDVDEEPRLEEVMSGRGKRTPAAADLDPAAARLFPHPRVPDEPMPAVLAAVRARSVTRPEGDPTPHAEAAPRPVVGGREANLADPALV